MVNSVGVSCRVEKNTDVTKVVMCKFIRYVSPLSILITLHNEIKHDEGETYCVSSHVIIFVVSTYIFKQSCIKISFWDFYN